MRNAVWLLFALGACTPVTITSPLTSEGPDGPLAGGKGDRASPEEDFTRVNVCEAIDPMLARGQGLGASIAVLRDGALVWSGGCGNVGGAPDDPFDAVSADGWPARDVTIWPVSSVSKTVMAVAVLQVVEELAWQRAEDRDDFVRAFNEVLDEDANTLLRRDGDALDIQHNASDAFITLRMLLTHTSGIGDNYGVTPHNVAVTRPNYDDAAPLELRAALTQNLDPSNPGYANSFLSHLPGTGYGYSSTASSMSALIVRAQKDEGFAEFTQSHVFDTLGMVDTAWRLSDLRSQARVDAGRYLLDVERVLGLPVKWNGMRWVRPSDCGADGATDCTFWEHTFYPAASLRSTVRDFARFVSPLMQSGAAGETRILEPETLIEAFDGSQTATHFGLDVSTTGYQGLVFYWKRYGETWYVCHAGRNTGYTSNVCFMPEEWRTTGGELTRAEGPRWGVIVFSNADAPSVSFIDEATEYLFSQTVDDGWFANL